MYRQTKQKLYLRKQINRVIRVQTKQLRKKVGQGKRIVIERLVSLKFPPKPNSKADGTHIPNTKDLIIKQI